MLSDRPIGCLLSGGIDSSLVAALVKTYFMKDKDLHTFTIGMPGATDIINAQKVADHIGSIHHVIELTEDDLINLIPDCIQEIESYDTTTVRASTPMFAISKWIKKNTDITVLFSGEGADEASGSYMYFHNAPTPKDF